jgi:hypothetical protein
MRVSHRMCETRIRARAYNTGRASSFVVLVAALQLRGFTAPQRGRPFQ